MFHLIAVIAISYSTLAFTSFRLWLELHNFRHEMSTRTREMNIQLTKVLLVQALIPLFLMLLPLGYMSLHTITSCSRQPLEHIGLWISMFMSSTAWAGSLSTILLLPGYRRVVLGMFTCRSGERQRKSMGRTNTCST